jgi:hypothetical protein
VSEAPKSEDTQALALKAAKGDVQALERLKETAPEAFGILQEEWFRLGKQTEEALIKAISNDLLTAESIKYEAQELRAELCERHSTPLERLLVDRVVCCWIAVSHADMVLATIQPNEEQLQRWVDRCHRRFSMACKDLATVHKLLVPSVQINVAQNQQVANTFEQRAK